MEKKLIFNQKSNIHCEMNVNIWTGFQKNVNKMTRKSQINREDLFCCLVLSFLPVFPFEPFKDLSSPQ